jgi:hypothetical protein
MFAVLVESKGLLCGDSKFLKNCDDTAKTEVHMLGCYADDSSVIYEFDRRAQTLVWLKSTNDLFEKQKEMLWTTLLVSISPWMVHTSTV